MSRAYKIGDDMKNDHESRLTRLEVTIENINGTLGRIEKRFDQIDKRFDLMDQKIDSKFDSLNNRIWFNFYWMIGGFATILGVLAHGLHWL